MLREWQHMAHDPTRIIDLTMMLVQAARRDIEANGERDRGEVCDISSSDRTTKAVKDAGLKLAKEQLKANRVLRTARDALIVKTYDAYMQTAENPSRKRAIYETAEAWGVSERTVAYALAATATESNSLQ